MNKGKIIGGIAAALLGSGLLWMAGSSTESGITGWETLNVSMEQAIGASGNYAARTNSEAGNPADGDGTRRGTGTQTAGAGSGAAGVLSGQGSGQAGEGAGTMPQGSEIHHGTTSAAGQQVAAQQHSTDHAPSQQLQGQQASGQTGTIQSPEQQNTGQQATGQNQSQPAGNNTGSPAGMTSVVPPAVDTLSSTLINVNTASAAELTKLPGVGEKKAQAILDYRTSKGAFRNLSDLGKVKGIGPKMLEKLRPLVSF